MAAFKSPNRIINSSSLRFTLFKAPQNTQFGHSNSLLRRGLCFFFVQTGNWGEVKSKREEPGENRNESARGTLRREKERREASAR